MLTKLVAIATLLGVGSVADAAPATALTHRPPLTVSITGTSALAEGATAGFTLALNRAPSNVVTVRVATVDGTALAGHDYTAISIVTAFTHKNWRGVQVSVPTIATPTAGPDRVFRVQLTDVKKAAIGVAGIDVTIHDTTPLADPTQDDLRRALADERVAYQPTSQYTADTSRMRAIDPTLDWGERLSVVVGDAIVAGDRGVVCMYESSPADTMYAIADIVAGPHAGTYYGRTACPAAPTPANISSLGSSW